MIDELAVRAEAGRRALRYVEGNAERRACPDASTIVALRRFSEPQPDVGRPGEETLALLDDLGSPATVASNGPSYFGFVIGAALPAAATAERMVLARDESALAFNGSPAATTLEKIAAAWVPDVLALGIEQRD